MIEIAWRIEHRPSGYTLCQLTQSQGIRQQRPCQKCFICEKYLQRIFIVQRNTTPKLHIWGLVSSRTLLRYFPQYSDLSQPHTHDINVIAASYSWHQHGINFILMISTLHTIVHLARPGHWLPAMVFSQYLLWRKRSKICNWPIAQYFPKRHRWAVFAQK